jgi:cation:H+ antiporter
VAVGLVLLVFGAGWLVDSAVAIASALGVSELVIGLTIVAAGTSLPEVATSVVATMRGERDIAVGNVVGSSIFNILIILGITAIIAPDGIKVPETAMEFDLPFMVAVAVACLPIFFTGYRIDRGEGFVFLAYYVAYTMYLILASTQHASLQVFSIALTWFAVPLTVLTLTILVVREMRRRR